MNTGNNLLFLIVSALLAFMTLSGLSGWQNIKGVRGVIDFPDEIYAGRETLVTVTLENRKRYLPSFLLQLTLPHGGSALFFMLPRNGSESETFTVTFPLRGAQEPGWGELSSPFPADFFVRRTGIPLSGCCTVFPRLLSSPLTEPAGGRPDRGGESSLRKGDEGELFRISDYSGAEPLKRIHWRLSARSQGLKVKELSGSLQEPVLIDPLLLPGDREERLSRAAWLVNRLMREQQLPVGLRLGGRLFPSASSRRQRLRLLTELGRHDQA